MIAFDLSELGQLIYSSSSSSTKKIIKWREHVEIKRKTRITVIGIGRIAHARTALDSINYLIRTGQTL